MNPPPDALKELHGAARQAGERVVSVIDLGTNSIRMDLAAVKGRSARRLHREKRMVRLGDGLYGSGRLSDAAVARVEEALALFQALHQAVGVDAVVAVATAAMRAAPEAAALVERWKARFGIAFRVISGLEEADLIASGVHRVEKPPAGGYGLVDIGGGSTEVSLCTEGKVLERFSLDLGANRLQQEFLKGLPAMPGGVMALRAHARQTLAPLRGEHRWPALREIIGSGGSIRAVRRLAKAAGVKDLPFTDHFLTDLVARIERLDRVQLLHLPGMDEKRVDLILPGALILDEVCQALGAHKVRATEASLRDGLLALELKA
jgi:exopolyphosphatase/guanosine-5'-triphosphate,3'-diphosphate pyrophosphatase